MDFEDSNLVDCVHIKIAPMRTNNEMNEAATAMPSFFLHRPDEETNTSSLILFLVGENLSDVLHKALNAIPRGTFFEDETILFRYQDGGDPPQGYQVASPDRTRLLKPLGGSS